MVFDAVGEWSCVGTIARRVGVVCSDQGFASEIRRAVFSVLGIEPTHISVRFLGSVDVAIVGENAPNLLVCSIERIRQHGFTLPILVVTKDEHSTSIECLLAAGADDFVTLPSRAAELPHRVMAIRRRASGIWTQTPTHTTLDSSIETARSRIISTEESPPSSHRGTVIIDGNRIVLTAREMSLLLYLRARPRVWASTSELLSNVCDCSAQRDSTLVRVHVSSLRKKLGAFGKLIESRRSYGYRWVGTPR
jgi:DNA-binding response OmpR family regulator